MYFVKSFGRSVVKRHPVYGCVLAHNGPRVKVETAAVSDHCDPAKHAKRIEISLKIDVCRHFNYDINAFSICKLSDRGKMRFVCMIKNMTGSHLDHKLFTLSGTCC